MLFASLSAISAASASSTATAGPTNTKSVLSCCPVLQPVHEDLLVAMKEHDFLYRKKCLSFIDRLSVLIIGPGLGDDPAVRPSHFSNFSNLSHLLCVLHTCHTHTVSTVSTMSTTAAQVPTWL